MTTDERLEAAWNAGNDTCYACTDGADACNLCMKPVRAAILAYMADAPEVEVGAEVAHPYDASDDWMYRYIECNALGMCAHEPSRYVSLKEGTYRIVQPPKEG